MNKLPKTLPSEITQPNGYQDMWIVSELQLQEISDFLSQKDLISKITSIFSDPSAAVIGTRLYPFTIPKGANKTITICGVPANESGTINDLIAPRPASTVIDRIEYKLKVDMPEKNFLIYEPYTTYRLYVPFIGMVDVEAKRILGKTILLKYAVDLHCGGATVYVNSVEYDEDENIINAETIYTGTTQIGIQIPFGHTNEGQAEVSRMLGAIKTGLTLGFGGIGSPAKDITRTTSAQTITGYSGTESFKARTSPTTGRLLKPAQSMRTKEDIVVKGEKTTTTHYPGQKGNPDPATAVNGILSIVSDKVSYVGGAPGVDISKFTAPLTPYLVITRTHIHDIEDYGHYFGYACAERIRLGDHHGYCEISNIHMEGMEGVTAEEIDVIENYLKNGVILP